MIGEYDRAIVDLSQAIELEPNVALTHFNRAEVFLRLGMRERALHDYTEAVRLEPRLAPAYAAIGRIESQLGRREEALRDFDMALRLDPKGMGVAVYQDRGNIRREGGDWSGALADYDRAITLQPKRADLYVARGWARLGSGSEWADNDARAYLELKGWHDGFSPYMALLAILGARGTPREAEARRLLDEAVVNSPRRTWPIPVLRYLRGDLDEAALFRAAGGLASRPRPTPSSGSTACGPATAPRPGRTSSMPATTARPARSPPTSPAPRSVGSNRAGDLRNSPALGCCGLAADRLGGRADAGDDLVPGVLRGHAAPGRRDRPAATASPPASSGRRPAPGCGRRDGASPTSGLRSTGISAGSASSPIDLSASSVANPSSFNTVTIASAARGSRYLPSALIDSLRTKWRLSCIRPIKAVMASGDRQEPRALADSVARKTLSSSSKGTTSRRPGQHDRRASTGPVARWPASA